RREEKSLRKEWLRKKWLRENFCPEVFFSLLPPSAGGTSRAILKEFSLMLPMSHNESALQAKSLFSGRAPLRCDGIGCCDGVAHSRIGSRVRRSFYLSPRSGCF